SDASPVAGDNVTLNQAVIVGGVSATFTIPATVPTGSFEINLGPGCSSGTVPDLHAFGTPARATLGNASFGLACSNTGTGNQVDLYYTLVPGTFTGFAPCNVYLGPDLSSATYLMSATANGSGIATFPLPVPNDPLFEGFVADLQAVESASGGAL